MKRFYGLAVVLILGIVGVVSFLKRPHSSPKISQSLDQSSQHNSSDADTPARTTVVDEGAEAPAPNSRTMNQAEPVQGNAPVHQRMAVRGPHSFVKHETSPIKRNIQDRELRHSDLVSGDWKLVTSLYAVPQALLSTMDDTPSVGEQNGFTFFEAGNVNLQESLFSSERPLVVYDSRLQTFGVVTGTVQIDLRKGANVSSILQDYGAKVEHSFPETGTYYITVQEQPFNLVQLKNSLETDSRVNRVEVEIVGRRYGKQ